MSYLESIENSLIIITGDGKRYEPLYRIQPKDYEFNISIYDFPNVIGSLADRREKKGTKHTLIFYFSGENNFELAREFEFSTLDKRAWKVTHPVWGVLLMQPISISIDPTGLHITTFTVDLIETVTKDYPKTGIDPLDQSNFNVLQTKQVLGDEFSNNSKLETKDVQLMLLENEKIYNSGINGIKDSSEQNEYINAYNSAKSALSNVSDTATKAVNTINFITATANFTQNIKSKIELIKYQLLNLKIGTTPAAKKIYELNGASLITSIIDGAINAQSSDYQNSVDVIYVINQIIDVYNYYIYNIDIQQTTNNQNTNGYVASHASMLQLQNTVNYAVSQLFNIALTANRKFSYFTTEDTNVILLTHKFYGADPTDANIEKFMKDNNIVLSNLLEIKKGTEIFYYA